MADQQFLPIPPRVKDHSGVRFGRLTVLGFIGLHLQANGRNRPRFLCQCDCGNSHEALSQNLTAGVVQSCGCLMRETSSKNVARAAAAQKSSGYASLGRHRQSRTPEHNAWSGIKQRCYNPNNNRYASYGGRGISMCDRWRDSFEAFFEDMGARPSAKHSIDRIDVDGNYEPGNVRWATDVEQGNNKSNNRTVELNGNQVSLADAERITGIGQKTLLYRINKGWPASRMFEPVHVEKRSMRHR